MENKKIRGTKKVVYNDITFKSTLEANFYKIMLQFGLKPLYEPITYVIFPSTKTTVPFYTKGKNKELKLDNRSLRPITYTPDFILNYNGHFIIIEAKGKKNDTYPLKIKMFRSLMERWIHKPIFFEVYTQKQLLQAIEMIKSYEPATEQN